MIQKPLNRTVISHDADENMLKRIPRLAKWESHAPNAQIKKGYNVTATFAQKRNKSVRAGCKKNRTSFPDGLFDPSRPAVQYKKGKQIGFNKNVFALLMFYRRGLRQKCNSSCDDVPCQGQTQFFWPKAPFERNEGLVKSISRMLRIRSLGPNTSFR